MKFVCLALAFLATLSQAQESFEKEKLYKSALKFIQINLGDGDDLDKATTSLKTCYATLAGNDADQQLLTDNKEYLKEFAEQQMTRTRMYGKGDSKGDKMVESDSLIDSFIRMTPRKLREELLDEKSTFPVADSSVSGNKEAAFKILKKACRLTERCSQVTWGKVRENLCGGDTDWKGGINTVHNVFITCLTEDYTKEVLASDKGRSKLSTSGNVAELKANWEAIAETLTGREDWQTSTEMCRDHDLPTDNSKRIVFENLATLAESIAELGDAKCYGEGGAPDSDGGNTSNDAPDATMSRSGGPGGVGPA